LPPMISDAKKETRPPVDANTDGAFNLVRAVMLVSREFVPRAIVPMHLHVIEYIAVFTRVKIRSKSTRHRKGR
jgi:hypothetical protein